MDYGKLKKSFEDHRFLTSYFETKEEAASYLKEKIRGERVGFGGSMTCQEMGLYELLKENNQVIWHWKDELPAAEARRAAMDSTVYILSANGVSETGELVNIDGTGNRAAASLFGPERVFYVIGRNRLPRTFTAPLPGQKIRPVRKMPDVWGQRRPVPRPGSCAVTTVTVRPGSAAPQ